MFPTATTLKNKLSLQKNGCPPINRDTFLQRLSFHSIVASHCPRSSPATTDQSSDSPSSLLQQSVSATTSLSSQQVHTYMPSDHFFTDASFSTPPRSRWPHWRRLLDGAIEKILTHVAPPPTVWLASLRHLLQIRRPQSGAIRTGQYEQGCKFCFFSVKIGFVHVKSTFSTLQA